LEVCQEILSACLPAGRFSRENAILALYAPFFSLRTIFVSQRSKTAKNSAPAFHGSRIFLTLFFR